MQISKIKPQKISIQEFMCFLEKPFEPVYGLSIPNILIPDELSGKKKYQDVKSFVIANIRQMFNSLTKDNTLIVTENLRKLIVEKAKNVEILEEIAKEFLSNFIVSCQNVENYMHLLNSVSSACILLENSTSETNQNNSKNEKKVSPTIGNLFLEKCRVMIFEIIKEENVRALAVLDLDDENDLDKYNKQRDRTNSLIVTVCYLYKQRNVIGGNSKRNINLTINHLYPLISMIIKIFQKITDKMKELGNPYDDNGDCEDEEEYEILSKMSTLYAEQIYMFISEQGKEFITDTMFVDQDPKKTMKSLVIQFKEEIFPKITESFLVSKCKTILSELDIE